MQLINNSVYSLDSSKSIYSRSKAFQQQHGQIEKSVFDTKTSSTTSQSLNAFFACEFLFDEWFFHVNWTSWSIEYPLCTSNFKESSNQSNRIHQVLAHSHSFSLLNCSFPPITLQDFNTNLIDSLEKLSFHSRVSARCGNERNVLIPFEPFFHWKSLGCQFYNRFKCLWKIDSNEREK